VADRPRTVAGLQSATGNGQNPCGAGRGWARRAERRPDNPLRRNRRGTGAGRHAECTWSGPFPDPFPGPWPGTAPEVRSTYPRSRARLGPVPARLRRGLAVCLGGLLLATPALGATYYLSNSGSDSATGTSPSTAWATLAHANSRVAPGDVVVMAAGTYAGYPAPAVSGTATQRITYVGSLSAPGSVVVTGTSTTISASHLTLEGHVPGRRLQPDRRA
jgi:hypothetical protein